MANKRTATSDLNSDNWNDADEPEDIGTFQKASEEVLKKRVVRAAKRRLTGTEGSTKSAFGSFSGFKTTPTTTSSPFSFLAKTNSNSSTVTSMSMSTSTSKPLTTNGSTKISENGVSSTIIYSNSSLTKDTKQKSPIKEITSPKKPADYYAKLKGLNQSVAQWIKTHVDANPVCILTPIFRDYEKYLKEIELKHGKDIETPKVGGKQSENKLESKSEEKSIPSSSLTEKKQENFVFGSSSVKSLEGLSDNWKPDKSVFGSSSLTSPKSIFSSEKSDLKSPFSITTSSSTDKNPFLNKSSTSETKKEENTKSEEKSSTGSTFSQTGLESGTFSFGQSSSTSTASAGFSFGGGKPFTFGAAAVKQQESEDKDKTEEKDEDDEPPKPDFKPITEEGSIYEQKCKVFVKKDGNYSDRGVGTLFLKPAPNDKMQLIVRAVNTLGNLLLNTLLTDSIPIKRLNKTNIMLVCLPLPTAEPPPVATLLRVKTPEEADALFEALEKHKK